MGPGVAPLPPLRQKGEPDIRVRIAAKKTSVSIAGPQEISVAPVDDLRERRVLSTPVQLALGESAWSVTDNRGRSTMIPRSGFRGQGPLSITSVGPVLLRMDNGEYPGELRLTPRKDASASEGAGLGFDVVENVPVETYLAGVVAAELFKSWSLETFKAQAVAARGYALHERTRAMAAGETYDVEASQMDQAYAGATKNPTALQAVRETTGQVLTWRGQVLRAYFSSCCGGRPGSARDTWPIKTGFEYNLADPIQAHPRDFDCPCNASPRYHWSVVRPKSELIARLKAYGQQENQAIREIGSLSRIEVSASNVDGRPSAYKVYDGRGKWYQLSAEQLRLACNTPAKGAAPIDSKNRVFSGDFTATVSGDNVTISGRGFGHGVGMCQYGAEGLSKLGKKFNEILMLYYPGAALERAY